MRGLLCLFIPAVCLIAQTVPMKVQGSLATVQVWLNGQGPFRMVLDTGSTNCSLRPKIAETLKLAPEFRIEDVSPEGTRVILGTKAVQVNLGGRIENNVAFSWKDLPGVEADGIIGQSLLSRFDYLLDYKAKRLSLSDGEFKTSLGAAIPFQLTEGQMVLAAENGARDPMRLVLDSGASNVYLWRKASRTAALVELPYLAVGKHVIRGLQAVVAPSATSEQWKDGLLPAFLFSSVYVSNSSTYVRFGNH